MDGTRKSCINFRKQYTPRMKKPKIVAPRTANKGGYQIQDTWFHRAKAAGYRARSAFKLLQIQEEVEIVRP